MCDGRIEKLDRLNFFRPAATHWVWDWYIFFSRIFMSVHGIHPLSQKSYSLAQLDYEMGGLNFQDSIDTQKAAHIASFLSTK